MIEPIKVGKNTYYIEHYSRVGIYVIEDNKVCLIDSGDSADFAQKILDLLHKEGWQLTTIINTHWHNDHTGGNKFLQEKTGCTILAPAEEIEYFKDTERAVASVYGGYGIMEELKKHFTATRCDPIPVTEENLPKGLEVIPLPGHTHGHISIMTDDGVWFLGDSIISSKTLDKLYLSYIYNIGLALESMDIIASRKAAVYIPTHARPVEDVTALLENNRKKIMENIALIKNICRISHTNEQITQRVLNHYWVQGDFLSLIIYKSTIKAYITYMYETNQINYEIKDNLILYNTKEIQEEV